MKYLVCRMDALRPGNKIRSSEYFPIIVDDGLHPGEGRPDLEQIVKEAFKQVGPSYVGMHEYVVVPMYHAQVLNFVSRPAYDVSMHPFV